jgi:hypothetical protein
MNSEKGKARWAGQFVFYLVLFALLISAGTYFWWGGGEAPAPTQTTIPPAASPTNAPAGVAGHDGPRATP